ncbi:MAG: hypothetical protein AB8F34_07540 [Akkermansiaceae bacterium]
MKQSIRKRYLAIALLALCLLLALLVWKTADHTSDQAATSNASASHHSRGEATDSSPRSALRTPLASTPAPPTHSYTELHDFFLPPLKLDGFSLQQAIDTLLDQYYKTCQRTGERPHLLKVQITGTPAQPLRATLPNASFLTQLKMLSALAAMAVEHDAGVLRFDKLETSNNVVTKSIVVPPNIASRIAGLAGSPTKETIPNKPHLAGYVDTNKINYGNHFRQLLDMNDNSEISIYYSSATSTLLVKSSERDVKRIDALLDILIKNPPTQIKTKTTKIALPPGVKLDPSDPYLLRKLSRVNNVNIMTMPSVISRSGEEATVEIVREYPQASGKSDWTGVKHSSNVSLLGFGFQSSTTQRTGRETPNSTGAIKDINYSNVSRDNFVNRRATSLIATDTEGDKVTYLLHSYTEQNAAGTPVIRSRDKAKSKE